MVCHLGFLILQISLLMFFLFFPLRYTRLIRSSSYAGIDTLLSRIPEAPSSPVVPC